MTSSLRKIATVATVAVACWTLTTSAAAVGVATTFRVQGTQTPVDPASGTSRMHPDLGRTGLVGDWQTTVSSYRVVDPWLFTAGVEQFEGCVNWTDDCAHRAIGHLMFDFVAWSRWDTSTIPPTEIEGGCVHRITGGDGAFDGARGLLTMRDFIVGTELRTTYRGTVSLGGRGTSVASGELSVSSPPPAAVAAAVAAPPAVVAPPVAIQPTGC